MGFGVINEEQRERDPFDDYLDKVTQPKQNYQTQQPPADDDDDYDDEADEYEEDEYEDGEEESGYLSPDEIKTAKSNLEFSMIPAETIVACVDMGFTGLGSMIAKQPVDGATDEEKKNLTKAWADYLKDKNAELSPGWVLVIMMLVVYTPKMWVAWQVRKLETEKAELEQRNRELEAERNMMHATNAACTKELQELRENQEAELRELKQQQEEERRKYREELDRVKDLMVKEREVKAKENAKNEPKPADEPREQGATATAPNE